MKAADALTVLVVDDELPLLEATRELLEPHFSVLCANSGPAGLQMLEHEPVQIVLSDQRMPGMSGAEFLRLVRVRWPDTIRMILSGYADADEVVPSLERAGIWQYLVRPLAPDHLVLTVQGAARTWRLQQENQRLTLELRGNANGNGHVNGASVHRRRRASGTQAGFDALVRAPDSPLGGVCELAARIAPHDIPVLVTGESGTGKEVLARAIHYASTRADGAFVVENCGAVPDTLLESELFGHKRGSFTGATESRIGLLQHADGGTLFLDEIGETSPAFQVKLLRALQEGEIRPVGTSRPVSVDVRVIAATNRDLEADVASGRFREDLYYRIAGITLHMPPLRERVQDIAQITQGVLRALGPPDAAFDTEALHCLAAYPWPGNVRELQNEVRRALALADGRVLGAGLLSAKLRQPIAALADLAAAGCEPEGLLRQQLHRIEAQVIRDAMQRHHGNKTRVADELGLTRVGLRMKLSRLGMAAQ
jgi:two-component system, NtrC family, response regulator HupR/HoxA